MYEEGWLKNAALGAALLAGTTGVGAGLGAAAPYIAKARTAVSDSIGNVMGVKDAGNVTRAREARREQLAKKVGGNAALGGIGGLAIGAGALATAATSKRRRIG